MGYLELLRGEQDSKNVMYIEFLAEYQKNTQGNICYGFVEGKDDPSFYRCLINHHLPQGGKIRLFLAKNKRGVIELYKHFDWRRFNKNRIVFFVDRDLSVFTQEDILVADNVYVTDNYSIENDIINEEVFESVLRECMGFADVSFELMNGLISLFRQQKESFEKSMIVIMSNILHWKKLKLNPANYSNIKIKDILSVKDGEIVYTKTTAEILDLVYRQSKVDRRHYHEEKVKKIASDFEQHSHHKKFTRGKYLTTFFVMLCNSIHTDYQTLSIGAIPKNNTGRTICDNDLFSIAAPRCRIPESLKVFVENTLLNYYNALPAA